MPTSRPAVGMAVGLCLLTSACDTAADDPQTSSGRAALAYQAAVRAVADEQTRAVTTTGSTVDPDERPVVYVVAVDGSTIDPDVQAEVAHDVVDDVDVRFADDREEAIDDDEPHEPVRADGVLLVMGEVPEDAASFDLQFERYVSSIERDLVTMSFRPDGESLAVTSTSLSSVD